LTASRTPSKLRADTRFPHAAVVAHVVGACFERAVEELLLVGLVLLDETCPLRWNIQATLFSAARLPLYFAEQVRISPTVRFLLSVSD
jgi:hypothetical protein